MADSIGLAVEPMDHGLFLCSHRRTGALLDIWGELHLLTLFSIAQVVLALVDVVNAHATAEEDTFNPNIYGVTALGISLLSNILATTLIGIKAWYVHQHPPWNQRHSQPSSETGLIEGTFKSS